jgi:PAS domain-containing protein
MVVILELQGNLKGILLSLFEAFSLKCLQLQQAIRSGNDELVRVLDRDLEPLTTMIVAYKAADPYEVYMQLQFVSNLIREDAADRSCVVRHTSALSVLIDRYFSEAGDTPLETVVPEAEIVPAAPFMRDDNFLNEAILDSLPDRVAVITTDYRYLYSNPKNATHLNRKPIELIGRHISDLIGEQRFEVGTKERLDKCFSGETVDFVQRRQRDESTVMMRCRMTPLRSGRDVVIGALVVLQDLSMMEEVLAA